MTVPKPIIASQARMVTKPDSATVVASMRGRGCWGNVSLEKAMMRIHSRGTLPALQGALDALAAHYQLA
jgi:hypothetical protein